MPETCHQAYNGHFEAWIWDSCVLKSWLEPQNPDFANTNASVMIRQCCAFTPWVIIFKYIHSLTVINLVRTIALEMAMLYCKMQRSILIISYLTLFSLYASITWTKSCGNTDRSPDKSVTVTAVSLEVDWTHSYIFGESCTSVHKIHFNALIILSDVTTSYLYGT